MMTVRNISAGGSIHQQIWVVKGLQVRLPEVDQDNISLFPRDKAADILFQAKNPGPAKSSHLQDSCRGQRCRVKVFNLVELGANIHLIKQVQPVVAGTAIRSQSYRYSGSKHFFKRRDAGAEFHVALRTG